MDDLVQWLRAQLDEDERIAQGAPVGPWSMDGSGSVVGADGSRVVPSVGGALNGRVTRWPEGPAAAHILGHDPARVLREIDAKRQLLTDLAPLLAQTDAAIDGEWNGHDDLHGRLLAYVALPYADRSGYREEWRP